MEEATYQKNPAVIPRRIEGELILIPLKNNTGSLDAVYTLNEPAAVIWDWIDGHARVGQILARLQERYQAAPEQLCRDLDRFLQQLLDIQAIEPAS